MLAFVIHLFKFSIQKGSFKLPVFSVGTSLVRLGTFTTTVTMIVVATYQAPTVCHRRPRGGA